MPVIGSTSLEELVKLWEVSAFAGVVMPAFEEEKTWHRVRKFVDGGFSVHSCELSTHRETNDHVPLEGT